MSKAKAPARKPPAKKLPARKLPARKLKVFVTATGFHDAYVAAPSRKAALAAWGSTHDLFARGVASEVEDAALAAEPLAHPGEVIKRSRGTREERLAALGETKSRTTKRKPASEPSPAPSRPERPEEPDDAAAKAAAVALRDAEAESARAQEAIARDRAALDRREQALHKRVEAERRDLQDALTQAEADLATHRKRYERDLAAWRAARA